MEIEIKTNKILEEIIPKLHEEDYQALKEDIKTRGLLKPIELMKDGTIVDGHHRYKICKELGIKPTFIVLEHLKTLNDAIQYSFSVNVKRRHLNSFEKAEWAYNVAKVQYPGTLDSNKKMAQLAGLAEITMARAKKIIESGTDSLKEKVRSEKLGIKTAYNLLTALDDVPKDKRKALLERVEEEEEDIEDAVNEVLTIIGKTNAAKSYLEMTNEKVSEKIRKKYEDKFYTSELDPEEVHHDILLEEGNKIKLKKVYLPLERFKDEKEADNYFKQFNGRCLGKLVVEMWVGEVDPYVYKPE